MSGSDWLDDIPLPGDGDADGESTPPSEVPPEVPNELPRVPQAAPAPVHGETDASSEPPSEDPPTPQTIVQQASVIPFSAEEDDDMATFPDDPDQTNWKPAHAIVALSIFGIIAVLIAYTLRDTIHEAAKGRTAEKERGVLEANEAKQYAALESDIVQTIRGIDERLNQLKLETKALAARAEQHLGAPLERLARHPEERPVHLHEAIYASKTIAAHWTAITNAVTRDFPPPHIRLKLGGIRQRIDTKKLIPADRQVLTALLTQLEQEERVARQRSKGLDELVKHMEARRVEGDLHKLERSR